MVQQIALLFLDSNLLLNEQISMLDNMELMEGNDSETDPTANDKESLD